MAEGATEKGVNEISAGEKNLDDEFKDGTSSSRKAAAPTYNQKHNQTKQNRKKERQNKKKGKR